MDPELQKKIDAARAEGYTDDEINSYLGLRTAQANAQEQGQTPPPDVQPQPTISGGPSSEELKALGGGFLASNAVPIAGAAAAGLGYGAAKVAAPLIKSAAQNLMQTMIQPGPVAPTSPTAASRIVNPATGQPFAAAPQAAPQTMLDKTTQMMKQIAANKVLQNTLRLGGAAAFAAQPSDLGPQVPQKGQFRGMEINPMTRRPWTREELAALNR